MDEEDKEAYLMACEQFEARKQLQMFKSFDYSQMKPEARSKLWKDVQKIAYPNHKAKVVKMDDIDKILGNM